jgi:hypothetical protein
MPEIFEGIQQYCNIDNALNPISTSNDEHLPINHCYPVNKMKINNSRPYFLFLKCKTRVKHEVASQELHNMQQIHHHTSPAYSLVEKTSEKREGSGSAILVLLQHVCTECTFLHAAEETFEKHLKIGCYCTCIGSGTCRVGTAGVRPYRLEACHWIDDR